MLQIQCAMLTKMTGSSLTPWCRAEERKQTRNQDLLDSNGAGCFREGLELQLNASKLPEIITLSSALCRAPQLSDFLS